MADIIALTEGADYYENSTSEVVIQALGGNDTIYNRSDANNVTISGGEGNDSLNNYGSNCSMSCGLGNDIIFSRYRDNNIFVGEAGNDTLYNYDGDNGWFSGGDGADSIVTYGSNAYISGGNGTDYVHNSGAHATIYGGDDNDNIESDGNYAYINGEAGNDVIYSNGTNCTILGGDGNDSISVPSDSHNTSISAGTGDDTVRVYGGSNISINGGAGNDLVSLRSYGNGGNVIEYSGAGNDTVTGFGVNDTLKTAGSYASQISGNNVIVQVGAGSILLEGAASLSSRNIVTVPAGSFGDSTSTTSTTPTTLSTGTSQVISNYAGQPVTLSGNFIGANFSGNNFVVNTSSGTLTIQNVTDKVVDLRNGAGREFIKAYTPSAAGVIDGTGIAAYEIIYGSSAGTDVIFAGSGGSQLWGGAGNIADALVGGDGTDIFIGGRYQGSDNFYSVSSSDAVNLTDATLSDIVAAVESGGNVLIGFNTGNIISIQSTGTLSAAINLADGTSWRYNHASKSWQGA